VCTTTGRSLERGFHRPYEEKHHPLVGTVVAGRYRILRLIGTGGMGEVLEAETTPPLRRLVVIKILRANRVTEESVERLQREAQMVASVHHPNICNIIDLGTMGDGRPFLVLERLFGEPLEKTISSGGKMSASAALDVFTQVLSALHAAHGVDVVHRDVKPQNVFLVDRVGCAPHAKILDFGFAKDISRNKTRGRTLTSPGKILGTPGYMSPEQLCGERVDRRTDLFSIGIILHEALTGSNPFRRGSPMETQAAVLRDEPPSLAPLRPDIPSGFGKVVARALQKNREDRFETALQMQQALIKAIK
jgi:serine/threonine-protein kinase